MDKKQTTKRAGKIFSSRKFKYGSAATIFTAFFIVAVILLNVIVSAVDSKFSLYFDLTSDQIFTISDSTKELMDQQMSRYREEFGEDPQIKISFLAARDLILEDRQKSWVVNLAESYAEQYPQISVEFKEDLRTHPENYNFYTDRGYDINANAILITNSQERGSFRYLTFDSCLVYDESGSKVWAFQGEMKINAAIMQITSRKSPKVAFTTGHGESVPQAFTEILTNCGFTVEYVNLETQEIGDDIKFLVVCNPQYDLKTSPDDSKTSEYTKLSDYLNEYRSMVYIAAPFATENHEPLTVWDELLEDWGLKVVHNQVVMDNVNSSVQDNQMLYANYAPSSSIAATITGSLTALTNPPTTISIETAPIEILNTGDGESTIVEPVLTSSEHSYVEVVTEEGVKKTEGPFNLMAVSTRFTYINNAETYGHVLLIGSRNFTETNAFRGQYGNTNIIYNIIRLLSDENIAMNASYKVLEDYALDLNSGQVYVHGIISVAVIPLVIVTLGVVVYIKRKHM